MRNLTILGIAASLSLFACEPCCRGSAAPAFGLPVEASQSALGVRRSPLAAGVHWGSSMTSHCSFPMREAMENRTVPTAPRDAAASWRAQLKVSVAMIRIAYRTRLASEQRLETERRRSERVCFPVGTGCS